MTDIVTRLIQRGIIMKYDPVDEKMYCPKCNVRLVMRNGPHGEFYACPNYPECHYTVDADYIDYD